MKKNDKIRVMVADDHKLMRDGIISLLREVGYIEIVGDVASGEEVVNSLDEEKPDVILMDIIMQGMTGIETTRWVKERNPECHVILVSREVSKDYISSGIQAGIDGYLPKNSAKEDLLQAISTVYEGEKYFPESIKRMIFEEFSFREKLKAPEERKLPNDLTKREFEILGHVAQGKSNKQIAEELFLSVKTVDTHKSHILEKMNFKNIAELVIYAVKNNIVSL